MNALSVRKECVDRNTDGVNEQVDSATSGKWQSHRSRPWLLFGWGRGGGGWSLQIWAVTPIILSFYGLMQPLLGIGGTVGRTLILFLLTWRIWWTPNNISKWQMGFNWVFKGLNWNLYSVIWRHSQFILILSIHFHLVTWLPSKLKMNQINNGTQLAEVAEIKHSRCNCSPLTATVALSLQL
jgi:hypothetical protein